MDENELSQVIVDAAIEVHRVLGGPGLLESVYEDALSYELVLRGLRIERQKCIPVLYKGITLGASLRLDLLVEDRVIVDCKAVADYAVVWNAQMLTYLRLTGTKLGLVINFGQRLLKHNIHRVVNGL